MSVMTGEWLSLTSHTSLDIRKFVQYRCHTNTKTFMHDSNSLDVMIVEILVGELQSLRNIRKSIRDQNSTNMMHVTRPLNSLLDIREFTLERNPFSVMNVGRPLGNRQPWKDLKQVIFQENTLNVIDVEIPLAMFQSLLKHWEAHTNPTVYKCDKCEKRFKFYPQLSKHQRTHSEDWDSITNFTLENFSLLRVWAWF